MFFFRRKLLYPLYCSADWNRTVFPSVLFSSVVENSNAKSPLFVDYLIGKVGLSPEKAIKSSKYIAHLKSLSKPDAVLRFLKESGFSDAHIKTIVFNRPRLLTANVDATLKPKLAVMKELGFSETEIHNLVSCNPCFLIYSDIHSKINFWRTFLGSKATFFAAQMRCKRLINLNHDINVMPKISFLHSIGFSNNQIVFMIKRNPNLITLSLDSIKSHSKRTEEMGFSYGSCAFYTMLATLCNMSAETLNSKLNLLRSFGWSKAKVSSAIRSYPPILTTSEKKMKCVIDFLVNQLGCDPLCIIEHPRLLMYSLERRMIPRNHILQLLRKKDLLENNLVLHTFMLLSHLRFMEKYIMPYKEEIPELHQIYIALCAGNSIVVSR